MDSKKITRKPLGRGLASLISSKPTTSLGSPARSASTNLAFSHSPALNTAAQSGKRVNSLPIDSLVPNPNQPRQDFEPLELKELADSIKLHGILQPVLVRPLTKQSPAKYEIIAGERRWRAAKMAAIKEIPALIEQLDDKQVLEIALIENIQREDLNAIEQALAYQKLMDEFTLTQKDVAERVGKERATVANFLRLLSLPKNVQELLRIGQLSIGHAKALLSIKEPTAQQRLAKKAVAEGLSVRQLEGLVSKVVVLDQGKAARDSIKSSKATATDPFPEVTDRLRKRLGTKIRIKHGTDGRGRVEIEYFSEQELDRLVDTICQ